MYVGEPALHEHDTRPEGFEWIDANDADASVFTFVRKSKTTDTVVLAVFNMTPVPREGYRVGVPRGGAWVEILNTDADTYGGSGIGNLGVVEAVPVEHHGRPHSVVMALPPLAGVFFRSTQG